MSVRSTAFPLTDAGAHVFLFCSPGGMVGDGPHMGKTRCRPGKTRSDLVRTKSDLVFRDGLHLPADGLSAPLACLFRQIPAASQNHTCRHLVKCCN